MVQSELFLEESDAVNTDEFVQKLREHDESSFALLCRVYGERIYNLAYRMTGNEEDALDIAQETFIQVYRHIGSFRGDSRLYTWIFAIAKNECFHLMKNRKRSTFVSFEGLIHDAVKEAAPSGIDESEKRLLASQVKVGCLTGLIRCLSISQRTAFIFHVLLHLPIADVAVIMDKSAAATKVLIHRARANLKKFHCKNCSLYAAGNFCRCENLIGFSLKQGWISAGSDVAGGILDTQKIEEEIHNFDTILSFYSNLSPIKSPQELQHLVQTLMTGKDWMIFSETGV